MSFIGGGILQHTVLQLNTPGHPRGCASYASRGQSLRENTIPNQWRLLLPRRCGLFCPQIMPTKVETKTNELCEAILEQINTNGIRKRIDAFLADATARGQYETVMSKGQSLQEKQHSGQTLDQSEISAFEKDRDALLANPVASGFLDAQEEMHDLQHSVQKFVAKTIELGRIPQADELSGEGGSCGHGCGCHEH
jgi:cell fate (sporulation/competence/biofilm development) regulator YlbF (YheA/YmcA/DUF963 family)